MDWDKNQGDISKDLKRTKEKSDVSPRSSGIPFLFPYLFTTLLQQRCGPFFQPGQAVLSEKSEVDAFTVGDLERSADRSSPVQRDDIVDFIPVGVPIIIPGAGKYAQELKRTGVQSGLFLQFTPGGLFRGFPRFHGAAGETPVEGVGTALKQDLPYFVHHDHGGARDDDRKAADSFSEL